MADRNINESIRKPRRSKGTPFYRLNNYYSLGVIAAGFTAGGLFFLWGEARKLRRNVLDDKFAYSEELKTRIKDYQLGFTDPHMRKVLDTVKAKQEVEEQKPMPKFVEFFKSSPKL